MKKEYDFSKGVRGKYLERYNMATVKQPTKNEKTKIDIKNIKNELDDMAAALRAYEDKAQQELYDLSSAVNVLAIACNQAAEKAQDLQDQIFEKIRNIRNVLDSYNEE